MKYKPCPTCSRNINLTNEIKDKSPGNWIISCPHCKSDCVVKLLANNAITIKKAY